MTRRFALLAAGAVLVSWPRLARRRVSTRPARPGAPRRRHAGDHRRIGSITATLAGSTLTLSGTYKDLKTAATVVRLHRGARVAMRGPAIADLKATGGTTGTIAGTIELTKEQLDDLSNGRLYVQLHSEKAPEGNLWGWLFPQEGKKQ